MTFLGRPIKPLAFALMMATGTLVWANVVDVDFLGDAYIGDIVAAVAGAAVVLLFAGWWTRSQLLAEWGLLLSSGVWVARAMTVFFIGVHVDPVAFLLSICWAVAAGGAFMLESVGDCGEGLWTRRSHKL